MIVTNTHRGIFVVQKVLGNVLVFLHSSQPSVAFHIKTNHLACIADRKTGLCMKYSTGLK